MKLKIFYVSLNQSEQYSLAKEVKGYLLQRKLILPELHDNH
ncbi:hypothetical protein UUU_26820 (plasmid) [Klebsiella pneumoniae subsp. pneumoniae DSM 30104 = JCM 1662 = NBRC 14940]|nr:hypothetical protein UUU_26820 [Klebsiella pneumoniae subsp. pneumoniae DSM 30104 = JCM 1662 = NBRC 14940]